MIQNSHEISYLYSDVHHYFSISCKELCIIIWMWLLQNYFWNSFLPKSLITIIQYIGWIQNLERPKINVTDNQKPKTNKQFTLLPCFTDVIIQNYWRFGDGLIKNCKLGYCPITNPIFDGRLLFACSKVWLLGGHGVKRPEG